MELLREEILPLFNQIPLDSITETNTPIKTALNEYTIFVKLEDVYNKKCQNHLLPSHNYQKIEHNIPLYYHQVLIPHRGIHHGDLLVKVKTLKHERFIRVNNHDLLYCLNNSSETEKLTFTHLDNTEIEIKEPSSTIIKLNQLGLPKTDKTRGNLYVLLTPHNDEKLNQSLLEILNYDPTYSNVEH